MGDGAPERRLVEERRRHHHQRVEPAACLPDIFDDEVARKVGVEPRLVLERVVDLAERHRARFEPAVEHVLDPAHGRLAGGVVRVRPGQRVDMRAVQVRRAHAEIPLELVERAVDVDPRELRIVGFPHRDRRPPEAVAADVPVAGVGEPVAEDAVLDVLRHPGDALVELDHALAEGGDLDVPGRDRLVDQRLVGPPAVRIIVVVGLVADDDAVRLEVADDVLVRLEDVLAGIGRHLAGEVALEIDRVDHRDAGGLRHRHVVLAEGRGDVDDAGALAELDEGAAEDDEGFLGRREEREHRLVAPPDQFRALEAADLDEAVELPGIGVARSIGEDPVLAALLHQRVVGLRMNGEREVRR